MTEKNLLKYVHMPSFWLHCDPVRAFYYFLLFSNLLDVQKYVWIQCAVYV